MKFGGPITLIIAAMSHPARGAWIEIKSKTAVRAAQASHPARGAWIEINFSVSACVSVQVSHPARGAWIEMG